MAKSSLLLQIVEESGDCHRRGPEGDKGLTVGESVILFCAEFCLMEKLVPYDSSSSSEDSDSDNDEARSLTHRFDDIAQGGELGPRARGTPLTHLDRPRSRAQAPPPAPAPAPAPT